MPTYAFNTLNDLVTYLQTEIAPNGTQAITGAKHQDVVVTIALSLVNIVSSIPPTTLNQFPPYEAGTVYSGGVEVVVRHANKLWLFVSASNQIGVTPGTNGLVWQELSAAQLAHFRNQDQMLDQGGPHQVTAAQIHALLNTPPPPSTNTTWKRSFDELDVTPPGSPLADVTYLVDVGATGAWAGHELSLASWVSGSWQFEQLVDGDALRYSQGGYLAYITAGAITLYDLDQLNYIAPTPNLTEVLSVTDPTYQTLRVPKALLRTASVSSASVDSTIELPITTARHSVGMTANVTFTRSTSIMEAQEVDLELQGYGSIVWTPGHFSTVDGVTLPTLLTLGERIHIRFIEQAGRLCALSAGVINNV